MAIDIQHLLDPKAVPELTPRGKLPQIPMFIGGGSCRVHQTGAEVSVSVEEPTEQSQVEAAASSVATDRFASMDFRVRWEDDVAYINRGRVYFTQYSPSIDKFVPCSFVIPALELPLALVEGDENASVWLSLPWNENDYGSTGVIERVFAKPDATSITNETYWAGFDFGSQLTGAKRLLSLFAVATTDLVPTPTEPDDYMVQLAYVGFSSGVSHTHFGSVFLPTGFDAELRRS